VDQQIVPCPIKESRKLITVMALPEACEQNPSVGGVRACARIEVPSTATASKSSLFFIVLTFFLSLCNDN
jgi:hypothetical protein